jgi:hypothetical protein
VPGFIAIKTYEICHPQNTLASSKQIIDAVAYSCLIYALLLWPISLVESNSIRTEHFNLYILFYVFVLFAFPVALVVGWIFLRKKDFVQQFVPHPTQKPWDYVFGQRQCYWVVVSLKNNEKVAGMFGPNSFASSAPADEQIYLEEEWILNEEGGFERKVEQTLGVIILSSEILMIEFFHSGDNENE